MIVLLLAIPSTSQPAATHLRSVRVTFSHYTPWLLALTFHFHPAVTHLVRAGREVADDDNVVVFQAFYVAGRHVCQGKQNEKVNKEIKTGKRGKREKGKKRGKMEEKKIEKSGKKVKTR